MDTILVIADTTLEKPVAIKRASELAREQRKRLHIVFFCYQSLRHTEGDQDEIKQRLLDSVSAEIDKSIASMVPQAVDYDYQVVWEKNIHLWVNHYCEQHSPALVVKTGHRSETLMYTSTDWHLIRECASPVMIVSEDKWRRNANVLAAVDLESKHESKLALNHKILTQAKQFADSHQAEVHVCYTINFSRLLHDLGIQYKDDIEYQTQKGLKEAVNKLAEQYGIPEQNFHLKAGEVAMVIPSVAATSHAGMIVVGTVGRHGVKGKVIGNTAEKILGLAKTDVIALKPDQ